MKLLKSIFITIIGLLLPTIAFSATFNSAQVGTSPVNGYYLKTDGSTSFWAAVAGGGSGGGTWSTTTSTVSGRLINYPNNTTDIPVIGSTATTTGKYWFDPNTNISYLSGFVGVGTTSPIVPLDVLSSSGQALSVTGGTAGVTIANFARRSGAVADIAINASGGDPQLVFSRNNLTEFSIGDDTGVFRISGSGVLGTSDIFSATASGNVGIGTSSPYAKLSVEGQIVSSFFTATSTTATSTAVNLVTSNRLFVATTTDSMWNGGHPVLNVQGTTRIAGDLIVGSSPPTYADDNLSIADFVTNAPTYSYVGFQNLNNGPTASIDLVWANNKTTTTDYYADCGLSGGNNADPLFTGIGGASAYYCFVTDGSFSSAIGTTTKDSVFNWVVSSDGGNSYLQSDIKMQLTNGGNLGIGTTSAKFALQVASTTAPQLTLTANGITDTNWSFRNAGGNLYIGGSSPVTFATTSSPTLTLSSGLNQIGIGTSTLAAGAQVTLAAGANPVPILFDSISSTGMYTIYRNSNIDMGYIGSAGVLHSGSAGVKADMAIRASTNLGFSVGSREQMRLTSLGYLGIGTTTPMAPLSVVGFGGIVTPNITATSTTATSTFAGGVDFRNATVQQKATKIFTVATTTAWTGTTTKQLGAITTLQTWSSATCYTTVGTLNVVFSDGTNSTNMIQASTTPATFSLTTNNRLVSGSKSQVSIGTPASSPTEISCTIDYITNF